MKSFKFQSSHLTILAIALHLAIVLPLAAYLNIWLDEAWTMKSTGNGVAHAWREAIDAEHQAPLYFIFLAIWRSVNNSLFFARLFSIICISATIAIIQQLVKRFSAQTSNNAGIILAFIVALHPYSIWASLEARVYALVVLLSALLLLFWYDGYAAEKNHRKTQAVYVFLAIIGLYTNYYLGFLLFANACALLALKRQKVFGIYVAQMIGVGLIFAPLIWIVRNQFDSNVAYYREQPVLIDGVRFVWNNINYFLLPSAEWDTTALLRTWTARAGLALLLFFIIKHFRQIPVMTAALAVIVAITSLFLVLAYFLLGFEYVQLRHGAPLFIPLLLLVAALLASLPQRTGLYIWLAMLLIFMPTRLFFTYSPLVKNGDWNRVAKFIEENEEENQPLTTFQLQDSIALRFTYHGKNKFLPAESIGNWRPQNKRLSATRWSNQIQLLISQIPANQGYLWLVTESYCHEEETAIECQPLEDFVQENYVVEKSADFYMRRVRLLRRK
jgi:uncharacterized membrane protein